MVLSAQVVSLVFKFELRFYHIGIGKAISVFLCYEERREGKKETCKKL
jgi:hypothetical protein